MKGIIQVIKWCIGLLISLRFRNKKTKYVIADGHIGEIVYTSSLLYAIRNYSKKKKLVVITRKPYNQIVGLYEDCYDSMQILHPRELGCLEVFADSNLSSSDIHWGWIWDENKFYNDVPGIYIPGYFFKAHTYGIPYSTANSIITNRINENDIELREIIQKYSIIKGKTVILIPSAQTAKMLPIIYWNKIARLLIDKGYTVFTNVKEITEPTIEGTNPIVIPLRLAIATVHYAGIAISIRCGLTDLLAIGNCKVDSLYLIEDETDETLSRIWTTKLGDNSVLNRRKWFFHNESDFNNYIDFIRKEY